MILASYEAYNGAYNALKLIFIGCLYIWSYGVKAIDVNFIIDSRSAVTFVVLHYREYFYLVSTSMMLREFIM